MPNTFSSGKNTIAECDVCGFTYKLHDLIANVVKGKKVSILACPECNDPDHPQLHLGEFPVEDPQAVENPRPDHSYYANGNNGAGGSRMIQWNWNPVGGSRSFDRNLTPNSLVGKSAVGQVTVQVQ